MVHNDDASSPEVPLDDRAEAIATFRAVTAVDSDDEARRLLEQSSWDLERAASRFLDSPPDRSGSPVRAAIRRVEPPPPPPAHRPQFPRWLATVFSPLRYVWSIFSGLSAALFRILGGPARAIEAAPGDTPPRRFVNFFEARYGTAHPTFFDGPYLGALAAAQSQLRFLLVYIHSDAHRLTAPFCRDVLASPAFVSAADASFVTWAGSVTQRDGAAVMQSLGAPALPFMAVVAAPQARVAVDADVARANVGTVLAVRAGAPGLSGGGEGAATWLGRVMVRHGGMLEAVREQRVERESARLLREQQDEEYRAALEADRAREREAIEAAERENGERRRMLERETRRERKREELGEEPKKGPGVASVALRLPDGSKVLRRFKKEEALERVFDWAEVNRVDVEVACLVTTYPRKSFRYPEDGGTSVEQAGLFPSSLLLLEERAEE